MSIKINQKVDDDEIEILQSVIKILRWNGLWPKRGVAVTNKYFLIKLVFVLLSYSVIAGGCTSHIIHTFKTGARYIFADILEDFAVAFSGGGIYYIIITFLTKFSLMKEILKELSDFRRFGKPPKFDELNKKLDFFCLFFYGYTIVGVVVYSIFGIAHKKACERDNIKHGVDRVCGLLAFTYVPFNIKEFPAYQIYFAVQMWTCVLICTSGALIIGLVYSLIEIFIARILHLRLLFSRLFEIQDLTDRRYHLKNCVEYHIEILKMSKKINLCLGKVMLMYVSFSSVVISLIGFQLALDHEPKTLLHISVWILSLFLLCYAGQRLIDESSKIPFDIYSTTWYEGDISMQKDINFIMMRSNEDMVLDAEGFCVMSLAKFSQILQNAYSIVALLGQTYKVD